jgi:hypothetical protein
MKSLIEFIFIFVWSLEFVWRTVTLTALPLSSLALLGTESPDIPPVRRHVDIGMADFIVEMSSWQFLHYNDC